MTHDELVEKAAIFLKKKYPVVATEIVTSAFEQPDAIGFSPWGISAIVECKANRSDFLSDSKKPFREWPGLGMGMYRYYFGPESAFKDSEVPEFWGIIRVGPRGGVRCVREAKPFDSRRIEGEISVLVSLLRRMPKVEAQGMSVRHYVHQTKCNATVSIEEE